MTYTFKRYPDGCYAVRRGNRRGPCGHSKPLAVLRYKQSGLIAYAGTDCACVKVSHVRNLAMTLWRKDRVLGHLYNVYALRSLEIKLNSESQ